MDTFGQYLKKVYSLREFRDVEKFKVSPKCKHYSTNELEKDLDKLRQYLSDRFKPNEKVIDALTEKYEKTNNENFLGEISRLENKLEHIINEALDMVPADRPDIRLWNVTKWCANNGADPEKSFLGNADRRWTSILKYLNHE